MEELEKLKESYQLNKSLYDDLCESVRDQLGFLFNQYEIVLATPITYRVKTYESVEEKCKRYNIYPENVSEINDIAGLRVIVLFQRDITKVCNIIESNFIVFRNEDTSSRLTENQFGYGSIHFEVTAKQEWCNVPTLSRFEGLKVEIQVRTAAQHIWAASSHKLQYKNELHVPLPLRRSINRTAAILEMVDLEFERLLAERDSYRDSTEIYDKDALLNVDIVREVMDTLLPETNKSNEEYDTVLDNLNELNVTIRQEFIDLISKNLTYIKDVEEDILKKIRSNSKEVKNYSKDWNRINKGVYYTHTGMVRKILSKEFDVSFRRYKSDSKTKMVKKH